MHEFRAWIMLLFICNFATCRHPHKAGQDGGNVISGLRLGRHNKGDNQGHHGHTAHNRPHQIEVEGSILPIPHLMQNLSFLPSVGKWNMIEEKRKIAITSVVVDHNRDGPWYVPSLHNKHSIGWNRTLATGYMQRPYACTIRMFGIGLESTLNGFQYGGSGYLTLSFMGQGKKRYWHGFEKNETSRLHCYYMTNKHLGNEFIDKPKTLAIVVYCPLTMDNEVGPFEFRAIMQPGYYCRVLSDSIADLEINLRPTAWKPPPSYDVLDDPANEKAEIKGEFSTTPSAMRLQEIKEQQYLDPRPHAVCTVQTFRNAITGPMLWLFVEFYHRLGWRVIIYDRFGFHREFVEDFIGLPGVDYHPYTLFTLTQPSKYNEAYKNKTSFELKYFYKMEKNWGYKGTAADTADQDADKTHTYDHARVEYNWLDMILYVDTDEFFLCPQALKSISAQRKYQQRLMGMFSSQGVEEMRFVRIPYSGAPPPGFVNSVENRSNTDFTFTTQACMSEAYTNRSAVDMFKCWSSASSYDNFPKSSDFASKCPFHYNHWYVPFLFLCLLLL